MPSSPAIGQNTMFLYSLANVTWTGTMIQLKSSVTALTVTVPLYIFLMSVYKAYVLYAVEVTREGEREDENLRCTWIAMETGADQSKESSQNICLLSTADRMK